MFLLNIIVVAFLASSSIDGILVIASKDLFDWYGGMAVIDDLVNCPGIYIL